MDVQQYMKESMNSKQMPKTAFEHASSLIDSVRKPEDETGSYSWIVDKDIQLSNIGNDNYMRLLQNDVIFLNHLYSMGTRDATMMMIFKVLYHGWRGELLITKTKNGLERQLQGAVGTSYRPPEQVSGGYGSEIITPQQQEQQQARKNIIDRLLGRG